LAPSSDQDVSRPALAAGLSTKILGYDFTWDNGFHPQSLLGDPAAAAYIAGTAWHCVRVAQIVDPSFRHYPRRPDQASWSAGSGELLPFCSAACTPIGSNPETM